MNPDTHRVIVLGHGQQGRRTVEKLAALKAAGYPVNLLAVIDPRAEQLNAPVIAGKDGTPGKGINDLFPDAFNCVGTGYDMLDTYDPSVVIDCSSTVYVDGDGKSHDNHIDNMLVACNELPSLKAYGVEKPAGMSGKDLEAVLRDMKSRGIAVIPHAVESLTRTKRAVREDIKSRGARVTKVTSYRLSATQKKSVETGRLIPLSFGGALRDKSPHDIIEMALIAEASLGETTVAGVDHSHFDMLEIRTRNGTSCRVRKKNGTLEVGGSFPLMDSSESRAEVVFDIDGIEARIIASHLGATDLDISEMGNWFTPEVRSAISTATNGTRTPESIAPYFGTNGEDLEARVSRVDCEDGSWYLSQTFAKGGGPFAVRVSPDGSVEVLDYSPKPYDGHLEWVRNLLEVSSGKSEPAISNSVLILETRLLEEAEQKAEFTGNETLDLREPRNSALADMLEPHLKAANIVLAS